MQNLLKDTMLASISERDIPLTALPDIELYMDQIITLFEQNLETNKRNPDEKLITKTMINNYSKEGLLERIKGKKYSREHILIMLIIYHLKQTLSIQDIGKIINYLTPHITAHAGSYNREQTANLYNGMLELKVFERAKLNDFLDEMMQQVQQTPTDPSIAAVMHIIALTEMANLCKSAAEALIDTQLPQNKPTAKSKQI